MVASFAGNGDGEPGLAAGHRAGTRVASFELDTVGMGAGDVWSTVGDLARWDRALASGRILAESSRRAMLTVQAPIDAPDGLIRTEGYGYGCFIGRDSGGRRVIYHTGDNAGFVAVNVWFPDDDVRLAVVSNEETTDLMAIIRQAMATAFRPRRVRCWRGDLPLPLHRPGRPGGAVRRVRHRRRLAVRDRGRRRPRSRTGMTCSSTRTRSPTAGAAGTSRPCSACARARGRSSRWTCCTGRTWTRRCASTASTRAASRPANWTGCRAPGTSCRRGRTARPGSRRSSGATSSGRCRTGTRRCCSTWRRRPGWTGT